MGDNNDGVDQPGLSGPVKVSWIIGRGVLELPWFGLIKLSVQKWTTGQGLEDQPATNSWWSLGISIVVIIAIPFLVDLSATWIRKRMKKSCKECNEDPCVCKDPDDIVDDENDTEEIAGITSNTEAIDTPSTQDTEGVEDMDTNETEVEQ